MCGFFVISDEDIVIDLLIKVQICQSLLILWLLFKQLFYFFYVELADQVEIAMNFSDYDFLTFRKSAG